ncbi:protein At-4/1 [Mercurialis annua]|uniref:protein At-4/1 n=1 Tax=Mercurialis annua TaxID=3986 RepID=UPI0021604C46|nr:protein At-4/1 [Mercurialis annua]XP_050228960.1 protein At-4/1 [Mercurialis annua]
MSVISDQEIDSLLSSFDQIYEDFKSGITETQSLRSNWNAEIKKREALELNFLTLKQENERLMKLYTESFDKMAEELNCRIKYQSLKEEVKGLNDENHRKEEEHKKAMELLKREYEAKVGGLEDQLRGLLVEKATSESSIMRLRQDLAAHKNHVQTLANKLERVRFDVESKYNLETQDLKDCLLVEYEEKNELSKKLQDLQKELVISRTKLGEQKQDTSSNRLVETLKGKIMKLRKENEILKRKLSHSEVGLDCSN